METAVTLSILTVAALTSVPYFAGMASRSKLRSTAREFLGHLSQARTVARSGREGFAGWADDARVIQSGLRVVTTQSYEIFVDSNDEADGQGEATISTIQLPDHYELTSSQAEIRFKRNGTLATEVDVKFEIKDTRLDFSHEVSVPFGGRPKLTR